MALGAFDAVGHREREEWVIVVAGATHALEEPGATGWVLGVARRLNEQHIAALDDEFRDERLAEQCLTDSAPIVFVEKIPMKRIVIEDCNLAGTCANNTVAVVLNPFPEGVESQRSGHGRS